MSVSAPSAHPTPPDAARVQGTRVDVQPESAADEARGTAFEVLQLAFTHAFGDAERARLDALLARDVDWSVLPSVATYHGLEALLYTRLALRADLASDAAAPAAAAALDRLRSTAHAQAAGTLMLLSELAHVAARLDEAGIPFIVLKGPALAEAYGDTARRPFVDNDLWVRREDFDAAEQAIKAIGYSHAVRTPTRRRTYLNVHAQYTYSRWRGAALCTLDLHRGVVPFGFAYRVPFSDVLARARTMSVFGRAVRVPSREDLLVILGYQGFKSFWGRLKYIVDYAQVAQSGLDWARAEAIAAAAGSRRVFLLGALLASDLLACTVPPHLLAEARADERIRKVVREVERRIHASIRGELVNLGPRVRLSMAVQDDAAGALRYLGYAAFRRLTERFIERTEGRSR
ncbi:MAG: nucleotidyltransferase family protein [Rubricoccaceae bacterium]